MNVFYTVRRISPAICHDAVRVGDHFFEAEDHDPLAVERDAGDLNEYGTLLGETNRSYDEIRTFVDGYNADHGPYNVLTNNCWHFSRALVEFLSFNPWRLPNPNLAPAVPGLNLVPLVFWPIFDVVGAMIANFHYAVHWIPMW